MSRRILTQYKRGEALIGTVYEEDTGNGVIMYVELKLNVKDRQETRRIDVPERDQDLAEMRLTEGMSDFFHEIHGKKPKHK